MNVVIVLKLSHKIVISKDTYRLILEIKNINVITVISVFHKIGIFKDIYKHILDINHINVLSAIIFFFSQNTELQRYMRIHNCEKTFPSSQCNKSFLTKYNLFLHINTHIGEKHIIVTNVIRLSQTAEFLYTM